MSATKGLLVGGEVIDMLVTIWMDGFTSGATSALSTFGKGAHPEECDRMADYLADGLRSDRLSMEEVRSEVTERLTGRFDPDVVKTWQLPSAPP